MLAVFVAHGRRAWAVDAPLTAAVTALLIADLAGLALGGSFWRDYLFPLLPGAALCVALLIGGRAMRSAVTLAAVSTVLAMAGWTAYNVVGLQEYDEHDTGVALREAAEPGDTLVVYGGRADVQLESGLASPYAYLWSLPMRTLDRDLSQLDALLRGEAAPTWVVEWVEFRHWDATDGSRLAALVEERYERHGTACGSRPVYLLRGVDRPEPRPDCRGPGFWFSSGP